MNSVFVNHVARAQIEIIETGGAVISSFPANKLSAVGFGLNQKWLCKPKSVFRGLWRSGDNGQE